MIDLPKIPIGRIVGIKDNEVYMVESLERGENRYMGACVPIQSFRTINNQLIEGCLDSSYGEDAWKDAVAHDLTAQSLEDWWDDYILEAKGYGQLFPFDDPSGRDDIEEAWDALPKRKKRKAEAVIGCKSDDEETWDPDVFRTFEAAMSSHVNIMDIQKDSEHNYLDEAYYDVVLDAPLLHACKKWLLKYGKMPDESGFNSFSVQDRLESDEFEPYTSSRCDYYIYASIRDSDMMLDTCAVADNSWRHKASLEVDLTSPSVTGEKIQLAVLKTDKAVPFEILKWAADRKHAYWLKIIKDAVVKQLEMVEDKQQPYHKVKEPVRRAVLDIMRGIAATVLDIGENKKTSDPEEDGGIPVCPVCGRELLTECKQDAEGNMHNAHYCPEHAATHGVFYLREEFGYIRKYEPQD